MCNAFIRRGAGPLQLAYKQDHKIKAIFCSHPPSRCRNLARSLNPLLRNDLRPIAAIKMLNTAGHGENLTVRGETFTPKDFALGLSSAMAWLMALVLMVFGLLPLQAPKPSGAVPQIQNYYQRLMPTIQLAA